MQPGLRTLLEGIRPNSTQVGPKHFTVCAAPGYDNHFVGWDHRGAPCVLLEASDSGFRAPLQLAGLEVQYSVPCEIEVPGAATDRRTLSVITCTTPDAVGQDYFLHLMDTVLRIVGRNPTLLAIVDSIARLVEILQQLARPARRSVVGLYGELTVIAVSHDPVACLSAWRSDLDDRFDFSLADVRLEAKATSERMRAHSFSFEQCSPPRGTHGVVASMFVEPSGGGQSLEEALAEIASRLGDDQRARLKLQSTVANSLGSTLLGALSMRFDEALARSTLSFFDATAIPAIRSNVPAGVTQIRFRSNLSELSPSPLDALRSKSRALGLLLPADGSLVARARRGASL